MPTRSGNRLRRGAALAVAAALLGFPGAAAAQPATAAVVGGPIDGQVRVTVDLPGLPEPPSPGAVGVTVDGVPQPTLAEPVMSERMAMSLVVDASEAGRAALPSGLSGAADFVLAAPPTARIALVADTTPPAVVAPLRPRPADAVRALTTVQAGGDRRTADALDLAVRELPSDPTAPRLVMLYTGAVDADRPAPDLVRRLNTAGVTLAVICTADDGPVSPDYWSTVSVGTGGAAISTTPSQVISAFDQLAATLRTRYLLTFPAPARLPATAMVRVDAGNRPLTATAVIPSAPPPPPVGGGLAVPAAVAFVAVLLVLVALGVAALARWRGWSVVAWPAAAPRPGGEAPHPEPARESAGEPEPAAVARAWNIPDRPDRPAGRERLHAVLADTLKAGERVLLRPDHGRPGTGTTSAMIEFVHRHRDDYDVAWWIPADYPDLVADRLAELAETLGLAQPADSAEQASARLLEALRRRDRWLLVFDDAERPRELARFLLDGPGHVVIISMDLGWRQLATPLIVPCFSRAESVALLRSRHPELPTNAAALLAGALDDLPLAVDAAASLVDGGTDQDTLLRRVSERGSDPAAVCWGMAVDRLAAADPPAFALLTAVAWLGPEPMPLALLTRGWEVLPDPLAEVARDPAQLDERAAALRERGLVRSTGDGVQLHRVAADLLVTRTGEERPDDGGWAVTAVRLLRAVLPDEPSREPATWPAWRQLLPHVLAATNPTRPLDPVAADVGWLLSRAAGFLQARGLSRPARGLFEDAYELYRLRLGEDHPDTRASACSLAADLHELGLHERAREILGGDRSGRPVGG
jgi:hypothetical protein